MRISKEDQTMEDEFQTDSMQRLRELLLGSFILVGVILILVSLIPMRPEIQTILRSVGLSLAPAGVVTLVISRYASSITEMLLRKAVTTTIRSRLAQDMEAIDSTVKSGLQVIGKTVEEGTGKLQKDMEQLSPLFAAAAQVGLEEVLPNRGIALAKFAWYLDAEVQNAQQGIPARVWIVASSMKGFLEATSAHFDGVRMTERIARCESCDLRIMMTDPKAADLRASQEHRNPGEIPQEVRMNLAYLKRIGVRRESVRFYSGAPTVFAVATTDRMLLNPYPYQVEAFRCFSLIVQKTLNANTDIFHQYLRYHFEEPWPRAEPVSAQVWDEL